MSYVERFYENQSVLRKITSPNDVAYWEEKHSSLYDKILYGILEPYKHSRVIEVACGPGIFLRYLRNRGFEKVTGLEMSEPYVEICHAQELNVVKTDALEWLREQAPSSIDLIVAIDFIEHLNKQTFVEFLDLARSVLAANGLLILRGPCADSPFFGLNFYNDITHETVFTTVALRVIMQMCNLEMIRTIEEYPAGFLGQGQWWKIPISKAVRFTVRKIIYWSTGQRIHHLSPDLWVVGKPIM